MDTREKLLADPHRFRRGLAELHDGFEDVKAAECLQRLHELEAEADRLVAELADIGEE